MARQILIDAPGDGDWIMKQCHGYFDSSRDHSFATHRDITLLGGFVATAYFGKSMSVHMAGQDKYWCSRELLWLMFDYCFNQNSCHKMVTAVPSNNRLALSLDIRAGWKLEAVIKDLYEPGVHMHVLTMTPEQCRWLNYEPRQFRSNVANPVKVH
jgi:hypothetical protein